MPATIRVRIFEASDLPVMDEASNSSDAFVEIHYGNVTVKTEICSKSLNPVWNSDWFVFEVDDGELELKPLQFRVMDYDIYSANDSIGRVYLDLTPLVRKVFASEQQLLFPDSPENQGKSTAEEPNTLATSWKKGAQMDGWLPIFDTILGQRGQLRVAVALEIILDQTRLQQPTVYTCPIFVGGACPPGHRLINVKGLVSELLAAGDPEYEWFDQFRTPR